MSILPGLIDGHCHYRDWMGEVYLAYGVVTCPNISNNPVEWIIAQREGVKNGSIRGPRVWASANIIDGPPPEGIGTLRRQRTSIIVDSEDEARKAVGGLVEKGVDGIKLFERLKPQVAKAAVDEAHKFGLLVFGHSLDIFTAAANGYQSVEHSWSVVYTSIQDPKKKNDLDIGRMLGKVDTADVHGQMEPAMFDKIIKAMIDKNVHWSTTWATWFRPLSKPCRRDETARAGFVPNHPQLKYLPAVYSQRHRRLFRQVRKHGAGKTRARWSRAYKMLQEFVRRFRQGGRQDSFGAPIPTTSCPGTRCTQSYRCSSRPAATPLQAIADRQHQRGAGVGQGQRVWQRRERQGRRRDHRARRPVEEYRRHPERRERSSSTVTRWTRRFTPITRIPSRGRSKIGRRARRRCLL